MTELQGAGFAERLTTAAEAIRIAPDLSDGNPIVEVWFATDRRPASACELVAV